MSPPTVLPDLAPDDPRRTFEQVAVRQPVKLTAATADDVAFLAHFVGRRYDWSYHAVDGDRHARGPWRSHEGRAFAFLGHGQLLQHLNQVMALATYCGVDELPDGGRRSMTQHLVIDLDVDKSEADLRTRYQGVCHALGMPSFVSCSPSGGLHVYYLLTARTHLYELHVPERHDGIVTRLLEARGLVVERGRVEIYPAPRALGHRTNVCRLPFGVGSWLLDPRDLTPLDPMAQGVDALRWVRARVEREELTLADSDDWRAAAAVLPRMPRRTRRGHSYGFIAESRRRVMPFVDGLQAYGTREEAVAAYAFLWRAEGWDVDDAIDAIREWLPVRHNGRSMTINKYGLPRALNEAEETVRRVFAWQRHGAASGRVEEPMLTVDEAAWIMAFVMDPSRCVDPKTGKPLDPLLTAAHAFSLLRRSLQEALTQVRDQPAIRRNGTTALSGRTWRDCAEPVFCVPLPLALRMKPVHDGGDGTPRPAVPKNREAAVFRALTTGPSALLPKVHGHWALGGMCAYFHRRVDLEGERVIADVATAFAMLGGGAERVRARLGERGWSHVAAAFSPAETTRLVAQDSVELQAARALHREAREGRDAPATEGTAVNERADRLSKPAVIAAPWTLGDEHAHSDSTGDRHALEAETPAAEAPVPTAIRLLATGTDLEERYAGEPVADWGRADRVVVRLDYVAPLDFVPDGAKFLDDIAEAAARILAYELSEVCEAEFDIRGGARCLESSVRVILARGTPDEEEAALAQRLEQALLGHLEAVFRGAIWELNLHRRAA